MDNAVNTRPLLQQSETDSDFEDDLQVDRSTDNLDNEVVVVTKDSKPFFKAREPNDRLVCCHKKISKLCCLRKVN